MSAVPEKLPEIADDVDQDVIDAYADLSGDYNPLHVDVEAGEAAGFGGTIAHGPIALQAFFRAATAWAGDRCAAARQQREGDLPRTGAARRPHPLRHPELGNEDGVAAIDAECVNQDDTTVVSVSASVPRPG